MMKNLLLIICLAVIILVSCKKVEKVVLPKGIFDTWELKTQYGGVVGIQQFTPGTGYTLQFKKDSTFTQYSNFKIVNQGTFHVVKNAFTISQVKYDGIYYNNSSNGQLMQQGLKDSLVFGSTNMLFSSIYVRQ
jgi:hypothetical protein